MSELPNTLRLSVVESKIARIRQESNDIESVVSLIAELRRHSPIATPIADLQLSARALRIAALKLDEIARYADVV